MINFKKNALLTAIVVLLLGLKTWVVVGEMPDAFYVIDNYVTVYIIFTLLDVVVYAYNNRNGDVHMIHDLFIVIVTDTEKEASEINRRIPWRTENIRVMAMKKGTTAIHGARHRGRRANVLIELYLIDSKRTAEWREELLLPMCDKDVLITSEWGRLNG